MIQKRFEDITRIIGNIYQHASKWLRMSLHPQPKLLEVTSYSFDY